MKTHISQDALGIPLFTGDVGKAVAIARKGALVGFPDAVNLVRLSEDESLKTCYTSFDLLLPQSGRLALLQRMIWRRHLPRITLESFLPPFLDVIKRNALGSIHWLFQNETEAKKLKRALQLKGISIEEDECHLHENEDGVAMETYELKFLFRAITPRVIILALPTGGQEQTALFLRKELGGNTTVICGGRSLYEFLALESPYPTPTKQTTEQLLRLLKETEVYA